MVTPCGESARTVALDRHSAAPGATALELLLPLMLRWGALKKRSLVQTLAPISCAPARILGVQSGRIEIGAPGDLVVFDPEAPTRMTPDALKSQGKNTPFLGYELPGRVRATIVAGKVVHEGE